MIEVDVYLLPYGSKDRKTQIGRLVIINDGTGCPTFGNYTYNLEEDSDLIGNDKLSEFPRIAGIWSLIHKILDKEFEGNSLDKLIKIIKGEQK